MKSCRADQMLLIAIGISVAPLCDPAQGRRPASPADSGDRRRKDDTVHTIDATTSELTINCDRCVMQFSAHCADCVVTHVISPAPSGPPGRRNRADSSGDAEQVVFTDEELRVVARLVRAGLVPTLLHRAPDHTDPAARH